MNPPPFKGGQGRTSADVENSAAVLSWIGAAGLVWLLAWLVWGAI